MSQKVKMPKEVCDALDFAKKHDYLVKALIFGYEPETTPEGQIKKLWDEQEKVCDFANGIREGIKQTLLIHGIHYDWLDGDAE